MKQTLFALFFSLSLLAGCSQPADIVGAPPADPAVDPGSASQQPSDPADPAEPADQSDPAEPPTETDAVEDTDPPVPVSLSIVAFPKRCAFELGENLEFSGLETRILWSDDSSTTPAAEDLAIVCAAPSEAGPMTASVSCGALSASLPLYALPRDYVVPIEGGQFSMGSDSDKDTDNPVHAVSLDSFGIGRYEVTYALWFAVREWAVANPRAGYAFAGKGKEGHDGIAGSPPTAASDEPVTGVAWMDAVAWCNALSEMSGAVPAYYCDSERSAVLRSSAFAGTVFIRPDSDGYRLPSEAEWEFAAGRTAYAGTDDEKLFPGYAWYSKNAQDPAGKLSTWPVGKKTPNAAGIFDMSGNAAEWCFDWYDPDWYAGSIAMNPVGPADAPAAGAAARVIRGGSFSGALKDLKVASRKSQPPSSRINTVGFRLARSRLAR